MLYASDAFKFEMIIDYIQRTNGHSYATIAKNIDVPGYKDESKERNLRRKRHGEVKIQKEIKENAIEFYKLNHDAFELGAVTNKEADDLACFKKIKKKYIKDAYTSGMVAHLNCSVFINELGEKDFKTFCQLSQVPLGYVANVQNPVNLRHSMDIMSHMHDVHRIDARRIEQLCFEASRTNHLIQSTNDFPTRKTERDKRLARTTDIVEHMNKYECNSNYTVLDIDTEKGWIEIRFELDQNCHCPDFLNHRLFHNTLRGYIPNGHSRDMGLSLHQVLNVSKIAGACSADYHFIHGGSACIAKLH